MWFDGFNTPRQSLRHALPVVLFPIGVDEQDICMRIDDTRHSKVLPNRLAATLILCLHFGLDLQSMGFFSPVNSILIGFDGLVLPCIKADINGDCRGFLGYF